MSYAEAARWLISIMGFDDSSGKPKGDKKPQEKTPGAAKGKDKEKKAKEKLPSSGVGWLGKFDLIYAVGDTLFETLMLNLVLLKDRNEPWAEPKPVWERERPKSAERTKIAIPDNQAELLTLQSRRILLNRKDGIVNEYALIGGDFFGDEALKYAFSEQMMQWRVIRKKRGQKPKNIPAQVDANRQMWRDFESIVDNNQGARIPGVAMWIRELKQEGCVSKRYIHFAAVGVSYGDKNSSIADIICDNLDFHASLLDEAGKLWTNIIQKKIMQTQEAAQYLGKLAADIYQAKSGQAYSKAKNAKAANAEIDRVKNQAEQDYYAAVDLPFREWLRSIDPEQGNDQISRDEKDRQWREEAYKIALRQGKSMVRGAGDIAFVGRWIKNGDKEDFFSSSKAYNVFSAKLRACFDYKERIKEAAYE